MLLEAEFLAILLVLVYVGAVMVLFLFVVMMLDINIDFLRREEWLPDQFYHVILVDPRRHPVGYVTLGRLLASGQIPRGAAILVLAGANDPGGFCGNRSLSERRAAEVARVLGEVGVKVDVVRGVGRLGPAGLDAAPVATMERRAEIWISETRRCQSSCRSRNSPKARKRCGTPLV